MILNLGKFIAIFLANGYPEGVIKTNIRLKISNEIKIFSLPTCPVYMRLPWIGLYSQSCAEKIPSSVSH